MDCEKTDMTAEDLLNFGHDELGNHFANAGKMIKLAKKTSFIQQLSFCWLQQNDCCNYTILLTSTKWLYR